jgi:hypothetical protein
VLPVFTTPLALVGLASVPALVAIYYFRTRSRPHPVSSLLLWADARVAPEGGRRIDRRLLPLPFWLELLAIALLVFAAAGAKLPGGAAGRPLVVVLDDSFSMRAGEPDSARQRAGDALLEELKRAPRRSVRLVLAGGRPQVLGDAVRRTGEVEKLLEGWSCQSSAARLDSAVALALELGGPDAGVLVLTDHAPDPEPAAGRVRWWAFGSAAPNWAVVNASRAPGPRGERLFLEVANLATEPRATILRVEVGEPPHELRNSELRLGPGEARRVVLELPDGTGAVRASLPDDGLNFDNAVSLLPAPREPVTYELRLADKELRSAFDRALKATARTAPAGANPQLVVIEGTGAAPESEEAWPVRVVREADAEAFTGPFVLDRAHPLTDGLSLSGVVWGGGKSPLPGAPVVMAGNVSLLTDTESASGRHELRLRLRPDLAALSQSVTQAPAWPALIWNLVHWRAAHRPGVERANVRLGEEAVWTLSGSHAAAEVTRPGGAASAVPVHARRATIRAERPGVYSLKAGAERAEFAANPLSRDESDLTKCATGRWGGEADEVAIRTGYRDATPWLLLLAAAAVTLHLWVLARRPGAGASQ